MTIITWVLKTNAEDALKIHPLIQTAITSIVIKATITINLQIVVLKVTDQIVQLVQIGIKKLLDVNVSFRINTWLKTNVEHAELMRDGMENNVYVLLDSSKLPINAELVI